MGSDLPIPDDCPQCDASDFTFCVPCCVALIAAGLIGPASLKTADGKETGT